jgi:hypothetical protein
MMNDEREGEGVDRHEAKNAEGRAPSREGGESGDIDEHAVG